MSIETLVAGQLIREARHRAGLSQAELAHRAGLTQSVVSAYESGSRQPSVPMLTRLVEATGLRLDMRVRRPASPLRRLHGPLGRRVRAHRAEIVQTAARHGATNVRVFGSVARGEDSTDSDVDLLVELAPGTGLFRLGRLERDLRKLLDANVDVVPAEDLKPGVAADARDEAIPL
jgi:predicted nucleotidyltransferase/DNA-binding XRE family transcriptional regulator